MRIRGRGLCDILWLILCMRFSSATPDPCKTLKVRQDASHEEIRRAYRSLCLRYHPDKNRDLSPTQRKRCEETFKDIQKAYSLIGNAESRRNYDLLSRYGQPFGNMKSGHTTYASYNHFPAFFRESHGFYRTPSFRASVSPDLFDLSSFRCIYKQEIPVSLEDLFSGKTGFELSLSGSLWQRISGCFRGGLGFGLIYQSILFVLPMIRFSKILSLVMGVCLFYSYLPSPSKKVFCADLKAGYKGGTRLTFTESSYDAVFVLKELDHPKFVRRGNDLYTTVYLTSQQAKRGATVQTKHLDGTSLVLRVPTGTKTGNLIRLEAQGWPNRRNNGRGDLFVQVRIKPRSRR